MEHQQVVSNVAPGSGLKLRNVMCCVQESPQRDKSAHAFSDLSWTHGTS